MNPEQKDVQTPTPLDLILSAPQPSPELLLFVQKVQENMEISIGAKECQLGKLSTMLSATSTLQQMEETSKALQLFIWRKLAGISSQ